VKGIAVNVRDEKAVIAALQSLAPVDHVVFSAVDKIIRGDIQELELEEAKYLFGVKFWGAVAVGKGGIRPLRYSDRGHEG